MGKRVFVVSPRKALFVEAWNESQFCIPIVVSSVPIPHIIETASLSSSGSAGLIGKSRKSRKLISATRFEQNASNEQTLVSPTMQTEGNSNMSKQITVIPAAGGAYHDYKLEPGTTSRDILSQLTLGENFVLTRGRDSEPIGLDEDLYSTVTEGTKLYASTPVTWGAR